MTDYKLIPEELSLNLLIYLSTRIESIHSKLVKDKSFNIEPDIKELYAFLYASLPDVEQEPIGYAWIIGGQIQKLADVKLNNSFESLYTHPQPNRDPLDNETILGIAATIPNLSGDNNALIDFAKKLGV